MTLPTIDVFGTPYEVWTERKLSIEESLEATKLAGKYVSQAKDQLIAGVTTTREAAQHVARIGVDNNIDDFMDKVLAADPVTTWQPVGSECRCTT